MRANTLQVPSTVVLPPTADPDAGGGLPPRVPILLDTFFPDWSSLAA